MRTLQRGDRHLDRVGRSGGRRALLTPQQWEVGAIATSDLDTLPGYGSNLSTWACSSTRSRLPRRSPGAVIVMTCGEDRASDDPLPDGLTLRGLGLAVRETQRRSQADFLAGVQAAEPIAVADRTCSVHNQRRLEGVIEAIHEVIAGA